MEPEDFRLTEDQEAELYAIFTHCTQAFGSKRSNFGTSGLHWDNPEHRQKSPLRFGWIQFSTQDGVRNALAFLRANLSDELKRKIETTAQLKTPGRYRNREINFRWLSSSTEGR